MSNSNRNNILNNWETDNDPHIKINEMLQPQYHELQKAIFCRDNNICLQRIEKMEMCAVLISNSNLLLVKDNDWLKCQLLEVEAQKTVDYKQLFQSLLPLMSATLIFHYSIDARYLVGIMTVCSISMGYKINNNYKWHRHESRLCKLLKVCQDLQKISQKFVYWIGVCWKLETIVEENETIQTDSQKQSIILSLTSNLKELITCFHCQAMKVAAHVDTKKMQTQNYRDVHSTPENYIWKLFNKYVYNQSKFLKLLGYYYCLNKSASNKVIENILNETIKSSEKCVNDLKKSFEAFQDRIEIKSDKLQLMSPEIYNLYVKTQEASSHIYSMHQTTQKILKLYEQINAVNITRTISNVNKELQNLIYNGNLINNLVVISKKIITSVNPELNKLEINDSETDGSIPEKRKLELKHSEINDSKTLEEKRISELNNSEINDSETFEEKRKSELNQLDINDSKTIEEKKKSELNHSEINDSKTLEEKRKSELNHSEINDSKTLEEKRTSELNHSEINDYEPFEEKRKSELNQSDINDSKTFQDKRKSELNHSEIINGSIEEKRLNSYLEQRCVSEEIPKEYVETSKVVMNELKSILEKKYKSTSSSGSDNNDDTTTIDFSLTNLSSSTEFS